MGRMTAEWAGTLVWYAPSAPLNIDCVGHANKMSSAG
jgi:hypothetical protein